MPTQSRIFALVSHYTDSRIAGELLRRTAEREHLEATAKSVAILKVIPEPLRTQWSVNKHYELATAHNLLATAALAAWWKITASAGDVAIQNRRTPMASPLVGVSAISKLGHQTLLQVLASYRITQLCHSTRLL